jgi:hypothetical protein
MIKLFKGEKVIAYMSPLWEESLKQAEESIPVYGAGPSRRSARRAAIRTLGKDDSRLDTALVVEIPKGRSYRIFTEDQIHKS